ncbi:MAG TPA: hypothetical protein VMX16_07885 [Terriglobia bacterium]|nr:hypothetical protein [Terriglobia bacterium]
MRRNCLGFVSIAFSVVLTWAGCGIAKAQQQSAVEDMPTREIAKLDAKCSINNYSSEPFNQFVCDVYNGSSAWELRAIKVLIVVHDKKGQETLRREYWLVGRVNPLSDYTLLADIGFTVSRHEKWSFTITGAKGRRVS